MLWMGLLQLKNLKDIDLGKAFSGKNRLQVDMLIHGRLCFGLLSCVNSAHIGVTLPTGSNLHFT